MPNTYHISFCLQSKGTTLDMPGYESNQMRFARMHSGPHCVESA